MIFVRQGVYRDGIFKFKIIIPQNYPADDARPVVIFDTPLFHPLVNPETGELDMTKQFPSWKEGRDSLLLVLVYVKKIFYLKSYDIKGAVNEEAAEIFKNGGEKKTTFVSRISRCVSSSLRSAYDEDEDNAFVFSRFKPEHQKYFDLITENSSSASLSTSNRGRLNDEKDKKADDDDAALMMKTPKKKKTKPDTHMSS